jgi:hypothetical protein
LVTTPVPHERVGKRRLAGPVGAHDRVLLVQVDREVDTLDDLGAVFEGNVQILDLEFGPFGNTSLGVDRQTTSRLGSS